MKVELVSVATPTEAEAAQGFDLIETRLTDFTPDPTRVEVPIVGPDERQWKVILLDAEDTFDIVIHDPLGGRECVWSLCKDYGAATSEEEDDDDDNDA